MAVAFGVAGVRAGVDLPVLLVGVPLVAAILGWVVLRRRPPDRFGRRARTLLFASRLLVATLLLVAAAGPYTVSARQVTGEPRVTMLVDRSASMELTEDVSGELATAIERHGVRVETRVVGSGTRSAVGDGVANAIASDGSVLVVSDGRVTEGRSLLAAASLADSVNATVDAVNLTARGTEQYVGISGPEKTSTGVENAFRVRVGGVEGETTRVTVTVDGERVRRTRVRTGEAVAFTHTFAETGSHRVTARIGADDRYDRNDVVRTTVRVVDPPRILYVARGDYPFEDYLRRLYEVDRARSVPANLSGYYAVVVQDLRADDVGNVTALQRTVVDGTGLVVVGGEHAFEYGGYRDSQFAEMLPVTVGAGGRTTRIAIAVDISGSTRNTLSVQQALALDVLDQLGDGNRVGVVAFNHRAYRIANLTGLGGNREHLAGRVRRLRSGGRTDVGAGIAGASELLGDAAGTVILLTDGFDQRSDAPAVARRAAADGVRVVPIGVGNRVDAYYLRRVADAGDGTYFAADETNRLRLLFGGETRRYRGDELTVVDGGHFVTSGVSFASTPAESHRVSVADRADYLVAGPGGRPAISAWRYGLGRTVAITAYGADGTLDGLLSEPDSLALTKSVNWAIGDPERLESGVTEVPDTRVGRPVTITYEGGDRPEVDGLRFARVGEDRYRATLVPDERGYRSVLAAEFAVNYPAEYGGFGTAPALREAVAVTGGRVYEPDEAAAIAEEAKQRATEVRDVRTDWRRPLLYAAVVLFLLEVGARRLHEIRGP